MSKLEVVSSKRLAVIDSFEARKNHLLTLAFSLLIGIVYSSFLLLVCSVTPGAISGLLLFGSQIAMGLPATRAYYELGFANRENLHFIDPAKFNDAGVQHKIHIHLGEIPLIFEKMELQIRKHDTGSLDDLSDLAWFGIVVWAAFSSTSCFLGFASYLLCLIGSLVFLVVALMSYLSGYRTKREGDFEDDLSHLQYYVEKKLKEIDTYLPERKGSYFLKVIEQRRSLVLVDFSFEISLKDKSIIEYRIGLPSDVLERILITDEDEILNIISENVNNDWHAEWIRSNFNNSILLLNENSDFSMNRRSSFVKSPTFVRDSAIRTAETFSKVLSIVLQSR